MLRFLLLPHHTLARSTALADFAMARFSPCKHAPSKLASGCNGLQRLLDLHCARTCHVNSVYRFTLQISCRALCATFTPQRQGRSNPQNKLLGFAVRTRATSILFIKLHYKFHAAPCVPHLDHRDRNSQTHETR